MIYGLLARIASAVGTVACLSAVLPAPCRGQGVSAIELPSTEPSHDAGLGYAFEPADPKADSKLVSDPLEPALANEPGVLESDPSVFALSPRRSDDSRARRVGPRDVFPLFSGDPSLDGVAPVADRRRNYGSVVFFDYDAFMGVPDSGWENNGLRTGINFANRLGWLTERTGICSQIGASVGVYDWSGTAYRAQHNDRAETQGFLTYGFYRKPTEGRPMVGGIVQDWSFNDTYGVYGQNPVLSQLRGQLGYATSASNEFGILGATHLTSSTRNVRSVGETTWRPISHLSAYWHHKWHAFGPDTWLAVGAPSHGRLTGGGSIGDYLVSANASCPLNNALSLVSGVTYMHPSASPGRAAAFDEMWNFSIGLSLYPGRNARSANIAGQQAMPLMNVANNGSFLVDTSRSY